LTIHGGTSLVTVTIGGNDVGFGDILIKCSKRLVLPPALSGDRNCAHDAQLVADTEFAVHSTLPSILDSVFSQIVAATGPNTAVIALDYPQIFPHDVSCLLEFTTDDRDFFRTETAAADEEVRNAAARAGIQFIDVRFDFDGHAQCQSPGPSWFNGLQPLHQERSYHPNALGQFAYAAAIDSYISQAVAGSSALTPAGLPANPLPSMQLAQAGASPTASSPPPATSYGHLSATATRLQTDPECSTAARPGDSVTFRAGGFRPQTPVAISMTANGATPNLPVPLTTVISDTKGSVTGTVSLSTNVQGFMLAGQTIPVIFLQAQGVSARLSTGGGPIVQEDEALMALVGVGDPCS
jgi:hypothetical protein